MYTVSGIYCSERQSWTGQEARSEKCTKRLEKRADSKHVDSKFRLQWKFEVAKCNVWTYWWTEIKQFIKDMMTKFVYHSQFICNNLQKVWNFKLQKQLQHYVINLSSISDYFTKSNKIADNHSITTRYCCSCYCCFSFGRVSRKRDFCLS